MVRLFYSSMCIVVIFFRLSTGYGPGCFWRVTVDGAVSNSLEFWSHASSNGPGWRIYPMKLQWYPSVNVGTHKYSIQTYFGSTYVSSCLAGYPNGATNNFIIVEEIEPVNPLW